MGEILWTVVYGLIAVFVIALIFIPHPLGACVVTPVVAIIYVELMGALRLANLYVNSVTAVGLIMSIGLVVDYNMHILLTYFEIDNNDASLLSRNDRVKKVLTTMGQSILLGGMSTFMGVLPLTFSTSEVFNTFFVTFFGIVFLGAGHGLIFTPVVLSLIGPTFLGGGGESGTTTTTASARGEATEELEMATTSTPSCGGGGGGAASRASAASLTPSCSVRKSMATGSW